MHRVAFVQVVPWHSLVLDELDLRLLFLLLAVLDTFFKKNISNVSSDQRVGLHWCDQHVDVGIGRLDQMRHQLRLEHAADERIALFRGVAIDNLTHRQVTSPIKA